MAAYEKQFSFDFVEIYHDEELGVGAYGKVCNAKCGQLPCAAKLIHSVLVSQHDDRNLVKFQQECQFLSTIKHPNIVQYLGTTTRDTMLVLLMELMDESLTKFLERSTTGGWTTRRSR